MYIYIHRSKSTQRHQKRKNLHKALLKRKKTINGYIHSIMKGGLMQYGHLCPSLFPRSYASNLSSAFSCWWEIITLLASRDGWNFVSYRVNRSIPSIIHNNASLKIYSLSVWRGSRGSERIETPSGGQAVSYRHKTFRWDLPFF